MRMLVVLVAGLLVGLCGFRGGYQAVVAPAPVLGPPAVLPILQLEKPRGPVIRHVWAMVTAYEPSSRCCGPHACGITSTGVRTADVPYGIAVDPHWLPYGTRIRVPGYRGGTWVTADDTGAAMRQDGQLGVIHIDVRMRAWHPARTWGIQFLWIDVMMP